MNIKYSELAVYTISIAVIWFAFGFYCGFDYKSKSFKNEAVVQGAAEYVADENGSAVWQWRKK